MLTSPGSQQLLAAPGLEKLSVRERELVALVAQGATNAQIAAQLSISVRTVGSHLDRIRDKTGCRRRADLTRLALTAGLGPAAACPAPALKVTSGSFDPVAPEDVFTVRRYGDTRPQYGLA